MREGLLWYDADPARDLRDKIALAAGRYIKKFGVAPNTCYVHPSALNSKGTSHEWDGVQVSALPTVLRHHLWLGREDASPSAAGGRMRLAEESQAR